MASMLRAVRASFSNLAPAYTALPPSPPLSQTTSFNSDSDVEAGHASWSEEDNSWRGALQSRPILRAVLRLAAVFVVGSVLLGGTLWYSLPPLDEADRLVLQVPKSFEALQDLNTLLKKLKEIYPFRTLTCFVVTYLYLQAFSLPGSMYLSILAGAVWGMPSALVLCCSCVATGASICYLISACFGPALLALPKLKAKIEGVAQRMDEPGHRENLIPYLIVLRMAPLPPHWAINLACPHLGVGIVPFYVSAFLGVMGVTTIHTTIGSGLDQMTSSADFHLISWRNFFGLASIVGAACLTILLRWKSLREVKSTEEDEPIPQMTHVHNLDNQIYYEGMLGVTGSWASGRLDTSSRSLDMEPVQLLPRL